MNHEEILDLWNDAIRPADKWLSDKPFWFKDPSSEVRSTLGPREGYKVECPHGTLPDGIELYLRGREQIYGDRQVFLLLTSGANGVVLIRMCRKPDKHQLPGWHGTTFPGRADPGHEEDRTLVGLDREAAVRRFCAETNISIPSRGATTLFNDE